MSDVTPISAEVSTAAPAVFAGPSEAGFDEARVLDACRKATEARKFGETALGRMIDAGRLLLTVPRSTGKKTWTSGLTRYETILKEAGVSKQAASFWQKAAKIDDAVVKRYVAAAKVAEDNITLKGLLAWANPPGGGHGSGGGSGTGGGNESEDDDDGGAGNGDDGDDRNGDGDGNDQDKPTHVCPHCGCLVVCDREAS